MTNYYLKKSDQLTPATPAENINLRHVQPRPHPIQLRSTPSANKTSVKSMAQSHSITAFLLHSQATQPPPQHTSWPVDRLVDQSHILSMYTKLEYTVSSVCSFASLHKVTITNNKTKIFATREKKKAHLETSLVVYERKDATKDSTRRWHTRPREL